MGLTDLCAIISTIILVIVPVINSECHTVKENQTPTYVASHMTFYFHNRWHNLTFTLDKISDLGPYFNNRRDTKILTHGWKNTEHSSFNKLILNAYLKMFDVNVIIVDWSRYSGCTLYWKSRNNVPYIGRAVALMLDLLKSKLHLDPSKVHIVGFSLGAHVAGIAGQTTTVGKVARITGLDPAGPLFSRSDAYRLRNDSARFVDAIHTGMSGAGTKHKIAIADFYPNGGTTGLNIIKSHRHAYHYFAESITEPGGFQALQCDSWSLFKKRYCNGILTEMGEYVSKSARGKYFLETNDNPPYAKYNLSTYYKPGGANHVETCSTLMIAAVLILTTF